jgi:hypothetical protein
MVRIQFGALFNVQRSMLAYPRRLLMRTRASQYTSALGESVEENEGNIQFRTREGV